MSILRGEAGTWRSGGPPCLEPGSKEGFLKGGSSWGGRGPGGEVGSREVSQYWVCGQGGNEGKGVPPSRSFLSTSKVRPSFTDEETEGSDPCPRPLWRQRTPGPLRGSWAPGVFFVPAGGPAERAGLQQLDTVLRLNERPVEHWKCVELAHEIR